MVTLPRRTSAPTMPGYAGLGLTELPFSTEAVLNPYSDNPRTNGAIYAEAPVRDAIDKFERMLIRSDDFPNRARIASLWSAGDVQQGRGMGKTAMLQFFRQRINKDWGFTEFNGQFSAAVIYAAFPSIVVRRWMEQLAWAALVDICKNGVLDASLAALRLNHLTEAEADAVLGANGGNSGDNLLDNDILAERQISVSDLNAAVEGTLLRERVERGAANALANGVFESYLSSFRGTATLSRTMCRGTPKGWITPAICCSMTLCATCVRRVTMALTCSLTTLRT